MFDCSCSHVYSRNSNFSKFVQYQLIFTVSTIENKPITYSIFLLGQEPTALEPDLTRFWWSLLMCGSEMVEILGSVESLVFRFMGTHEDPYFRELNKDCTKCQYQCIKTHCAQICPGTTSFYQLILPIDKKNVIVQTYVKNCTYVYTNMY